VEGAIFIPSLWEKGLGVTLEEKKKKSFDVKTKGNHKQWSEKGNGYMIKERV